MPTPTYTPLATLTLSSSAASVTFSSINQGFRDLVLVIDPGIYPSNTFGYRFNSDAGSNYNHIHMSGNGSTTNSQAFPTDRGYLSYTGSAPGTVGYINIANIMDYSATDKHKTVLTRAGHASDSTVAIATRWASTAAITSISIFFASGNIPTGATFALYGIAA